jgi:selenocysteine-specific translation elongation factor
VFVADGYIRRHETLQAFPTGKPAQVRSIQKHDDDFEWAGTGDRVGLALKGVDVGEVERGSVLTTDPAVRAAGEVTAPATLVKYWQTPLRPGMVLHLGHWMQFELARVTAVDDSAGWRSPLLTLALEKPLIFRPGGRAVLHYLEGGKLRIAGTLLLRT